MEAPVARAAVASRPVLDRTAWDDKCLFGVILSHDHTHHSLSVALTLGLIPLAICCLSALGIPGGPAETSSPDSLRALAHVYYSWRDSSYPVGASDQGLHTWDDRLTDYRPASVESRNRHVRELLARVKAMSTDGWSKDDRIDWYLFRAQLEGADFFP